MVNHKCSLCFYQNADHNELIKHYVKYHKHDPEFRVECFQCGATYNNWKSFLRHQSRHHNNICAIPNAADQIIAQQAMEVDNPNEGL